MKKIIFLCSFLFMGMIAFGQVVYTDTLSGTTVEDLQNKGWLVGGYTADNGGLYNNANPGDNLWSGLAHLYGSYNSINATVTFDYITGSNSGKPITVEIYLTNDNMSNYVWAGEATIYDYNDSVHHASVVLNGQIGSNTGWWPEGNYNLVIGFSFPSGAPTADKQITLLGNFVVAYNSAMPVDFADFSVNKSSQGILLNWTTGSEQNNSYFVIQKSSDGKNFTDVGKVATQAPNGNSSQKLNYSYLIPTVQ